MRKIVIRILFFIFSSCFLCPAQLQTTDMEPIFCKKKADMVIFSYDRPLQLYALLESINLYMEGLGQVHLIYRASDDRYEQAYDKVHQAFTSIVFVKQGANPHEDFKPLTLKAVFESPNEYVIFAVDDIIVKDFVDLTECIDLLEKTNAWGFYLRLGKNLSENYPHNCKQRVPPCTPVADGILTWRFSQAQFDWRYPHTVDMTLYCKSDIEKDIREISFSAPNSFEACWAARRPMREWGLCYEQSKIVNLPLNRVQDDIKNRHMNFLRPLELLEQFEKGERINIYTLFKLANKSSHAEYAPRFIGMRQ